jgi:hypothetical protein
VSARLWMLAAAAALALAITGCPHTETPKRVEIFAVTTAPPARVAQIVSSDTEHRIVITRGVAVAVSSWTSCPGDTKTVLAPAEPAVLDARSVYRNGAPNQFVLWGQRAGTTTLSVQNNCTEQRYDVTVLAD